MPTQPQQQPASQIVDPDMLVRLNKAVTRPINPLVAAADSVLESIWCDPATKDPGQIQDGWGACADCFDYHMLFQTHCLTCSTGL